MPPTAKVFLNSMQCLGNLGKIVSWCLPFRVGAPPTGNPVSAPAWTFCGQCFTLCGRSIFLCR